MSKIIYISYHEREGIMASLGMTLITIHEDENLTLLFRNLIKQKISIVYVSEEVYLSHKKVIDSYDKEFDISINVLANNIDRRGIADQRFDRLVEDAIGIKGNDEEEA